MRNHIFSKLVLFLFGCLITLNAQQRGFEPGYIITIEGDTLIGQVKDRSQEPFVELYRRIRFKPEGKSARRKFGPNEILGYRAGVREYESVPLREETAFFKFRYYVDQAVDKVFLQLIRRDGLLTYYHNEFIHDDNNFVDFYPLFHREGEAEMVRVTQGIFGLKRERLMRYFRDCEQLVMALQNKELKKAEEVYDFYLKKCLQLPTATNNLHTLEGSWEIDLRPTPEAPPYLQEFRVNRITGNAFMGSFYGSQIEKGRINRNWNRLYFAFVTRDQSHEYIHSGYMEEGVLHGVSYCPGREFVAPWKGVPK